MITFNNIVERFEDFATSHFFIKSFSFGSPDDVDLAKFTEFPLMHLVYTGATYDSGTKTYNIEVYILDVPADKSDKVERQREVVSDAEQCAEDIIADIRMGGNIFTFAQDYEVVNATTTPLEEETKNVLSGVLLDLSVAIPYEWDACNAPIDGVTPGGGDEPSYARRGFLRMLTLDGSTDVLSVRTIKVNNGTLTDDGDGVVTLDTGGIDTLDDLTDVDINDPDQGDVLSYNAGVQKWMVNGGLQELLARFRASGTGAQMYDTLNDTTKGYVDVLANSAKMAVNLSGLTVTEASPGVMSFTVAAGTEGNEVEFEALTIEGSDALSTVAEINFKQGALTYWENSTGKIWLRPSNVGNITVLLPSSTGTLALTTDIPSVPVDSVNGQTGVVVLDTGDIDENGNLYFTDARVAANAAVAANTAKVGITSQQAADITTNNAKTGITPTQAGEITANTAKVGVIAGGTSGQALVKASGTDYDTEWADIAIDTQYHDRFATDAETFRSGATDTVELYYTAKADGDGLAEDAESDTPTAGKVIKRKIYYSEAAFADPDTATWVEFTTLADDITFANAKAALLEYLKARTGGTVPISLKQTWEEVTAAPAFTGLLNETYGSGAEAAYSTRRLNGLYSGDCMTIRRASDSTTQSIGFVGEEIDESAIETFCSGTSCTVQVWRDQSGNGNDATAPSTTNEPTIYTGGQLVKEGGRLSLEFNTSWLLSASEIMNAYPLTAFSIVKFTSVSGGRWYLDQSGTYGPGFKNSSSGDGLRVFYNYGSYGFLDTTTSVLNKQILSTASLVSSNQTLYVDGVSVATESTAFSGSGLSGVDFAIGTDTSNTTSRAFTGEIQEIVIYTSDKSSDRTSIEGNISVYFQSAKLLDEQYGSGAEAAYSTRQLRRDQTDCMVIRRASDSTTTTIGFDTEGNIDETAIETFCTGTTCTVSSWLDQSGNGNDATQATAANQPTIYTGGQLVKESGRVAVEFDGSNDTMETADFSSLIGAPNFFSACISFDDTADQYFIDSDSPGRSATGIISGNYSMRGLNGGAASTGKHLMSVSQLSSGAALFVDSSQVLTNGSSTLMTHTNILISDNALRFDGKFQELTLWSADKSSDRTSIEENVGDYFTQNTPLLDTYSGAAAAYSLRKLSSTYTGDAVEVYNGSSYADIGFNVFGELDTVALASHCGSNDGFVSKWYDQAGSNDATQTTTANMPKIYDGTTGVELKNARPIMINTNGNAHLVSSLQINGGTHVFHVQGITTTYPLCISLGGGFAYYMYGNALSTIGASDWYVDGQLGTDRGIGSRQNLYTYAGTNNFIASASISTTSTNPVYLGTSVSNYGMLNMQEMIIYPSDQSANRTNIEDNINTFYSIY